MCLVLLSFQHFHLPYETPFLRAHLYGSIRAFQICSKLTARRKWETLSIWKTHMILQYLIHMILYTLRQYMENKNHVSIKSLKEKSNIKPHLSVGLPHAQMTNLETWSDLTDQLFYIAKQLFSFSV